MPSINRLLSDNIPVDPSRNTFIGNGSQTVFNLSGQVAAGSTNPSNLIVSLDGAMQEPIIDYTINNSTLTFTTAPDNGAKVVIISRNSPFTYATNLPGDGTVTSAKIVAGNVTPDKLSTGAPTWNTGGDLTVNGNILSRNLLLQGDNTNAYIRPNNANSNLYLGTHSSNHVALLSNGNFGIGNLGPTAKLQVQTASLGTTIGSKSNSLILQSTNGNLSLLEINEYRVSAGTGWETAGYRIQQKTDATFQSYIQFNGNNNHGISVGTGASTVSPHSVTERIRITENGTIDLKNNPVINCINVSDAWMMGYPPIVQVRTIAPVSMRLKPFIGQNRVDWEHDTVNFWNNRYVGAVYYIRRQDQVTDFVGVPPVSRPNGLDGVRIRLVEIIQNTPKSIMRCEFLDGIPNSDQILFGAGNASGFTYSSNGLFKSYNVANFIRYGTGDYGITFVNPMPDRSYCALGNAGDNNGGHANMVVNFDFTNNPTAVAPDFGGYYTRRTTNLLRFCTRYGVNNVTYDVSNINIAVFASSNQDNF